jgi:hypothetical protein
MRVLGRRFSNWWLLLLVPVLLVVLLPVPAFMSLLIGSHMLAAIVGPPAIWNMPLHAPVRADLVGRYVESERHWYGPKAQTRAALELRSDGTMTVNDLPVDFASSTCTLSGIGTWTGPDTDRHLHLVLPSNESGDACQSGDYPLVEIAGHSKPYELYWVLGDPDEGTGVWLKRH